VTVASSTSKPRRTAVSWRSGLEQKVQEDLAARGVPYRYEEVKVRYTKPATDHTYTPDFILPNGIIVETKGLFDCDDRKKHEMLAAQHPDLDIRFVFSRSASPIRKGSKTTYAAWCAKRGFPFADKLIPETWVREADDPTRHAAIAAATA
jgi:hypothetical protein